MTRLPSLFGRALRVLLGVALLLAAGAVAFLYVAETLGPDPGERDTFTEEVRYWTPGDGWREGVSTRTVAVHETAAGMEVRWRIDGPHSPRGYDFSFLTAPDLELLEDPGVRAGFSPTPYPADPPSTVYLAVPWETGTRDFAGAIDAFTLVGTERLHGVHVLRYEAHHENQFYWDGEGPIWYRAAERTVLVEPVTGKVVAYQQHETLWQREEAVYLPVPVLRDAISPREKVWEAHVSTTPATEAQRAEEADRSRDGYHLRLALGGVPLMLLGEFALWRGIRGRPA